VIVLLLVLGVLGGLSGAGLAALFRKRRAWARLPVGRQRLGAAIIFGATGLVHLLAGAYLLRFL
jgi:hypothetical protein